MRETKEFAEQSVEVGTKVGWLLRGVHDSLLRRFSRKWECQNVPECVLNRVLARVGYPT